MCGRCNSCCLLNAQQGSDWERAGSLPWVALIGLVHLCFQIVKIGAVIWILFWLILKDWCVKCLVPRWCYWEVVDLRAGWRGVLRSLGESFGRLLSCGLSSSMQGLLGKLQFVSPHSSLLLGLPCVPPSTFVPPLPSIALSEAKSM